VKPRIVKRRTPHEPRGEWLLIYDQDVANYTIWHEHHDRINFAHAYTWMREHGLNHLDAVSAANQIIPTRNPFTGFFFPGPDSWKAKPRKDTP